MDGHTGMPVFSRCVTQEKGQWGAGNGSWRTNVVQRPVWQQTDPHRPTASWLTSFVLSLILFLLTVFLFPVCHFITVYNSINRTMNHTFQWKGMWRIASSNAFPLGTGNQLPEKFETCEKLEGCFTTPQRLKCKSGLSELLPRQAQGTRKKMTRQKRSYLGLFS